MRELAILLVLVHRFAPEALTLVADLPHTWQMAALAWHTLAG
mgnify:FL=1